MGQGKSTNIDGIPDRKSSFAESNEGSTSPRAGTIRQQSLLLNARPKGTNRGLIVQGGGDSNTEYRRHSMASQFSDETQPSGVVAGRPPTMARRDSHSLKMRDNMTRSRSHLSGSIGTGSANYTQSWETFNPQDASQGDMSTRTSNVSGFSGFKRPRSSVEDNGEPLSKRHLHDDRGRWNRGGMHMNEHDWRNLAIDNIKKDMKTLTQWNPNTEKEEWTFETVQSARNGSDTSTPRSAQRTASDIPPLSSSRTTYTDVTPSVNPDPQSQWKAPAVPPPIVSDTRPGPSTQTGGGETAGQKPATMWGRPIIPNRASPTWARR